MTGMLTAPFKLENMRPIISFILVIIATVCANAQTVQFGVVKEYNEIPVTLQ